MKPGKTPVMKKPNWESLAWIPLACVLVAALLLAFLLPITTALRAVVLSVIGVGLAWVVILLLLLARTPEGHGRLASSPPVALDLLSLVPFIGCAVLFGAIGPSGPGAESPLVGLAAGAVLMVPFSLTVRWLWWEREHRQDSSRRTGDE